MLVKQWAQAEWKPAGYDGAERAMLRLSPESGRTSLVRIKAGIHAPRHRHEAGEDVLVLSGRIRIGGHELGPGDYLYTDAGEEHDVVALEDSMFYVSSSKPVHVLPPK
jgi:quercetin dioxygenase-like cupin family protein